MCLTHQQAVAPVRGCCVKHTNPERTRKLLRTAGMPLQDRSRGAGLAPRPKPRRGPRSDRSRVAGALRNSHWTKATRTYVNMFEGPVTGNIPEVLDNGEVTDGTRVTAGQLALALTPYAQVTDLAVNTAASGNNAAAIQSLDDRVTAELASGRPWPPRTDRWPRTEAASPRCRAR